MTHHRFASRVSIALMTAVLLNVGGTAMAGPARRVCRQTCGNLIRHQCRRLFGGVRPRCKAAILRQCRLEGPAACELSRTCDRSCAEIVAQCLDATRGGPNFVCDPFAYQRCEEHGAAFCAAAPTTTNGCNRVAAEDHRGEPVVTVTFSQADVSYDYSPECIIVSAGTTVRFQGPFAEEPLVGGQAPVPDADSPFSPPTTDGTSQDFVLATPGIFPYFGADFATSPFPVGFALPWGAVIVDDAS